MRGCLWLQRWFFKRLCTSWEGWLLHLHPDATIQQHDAAHSASAEEEEEEEGCSGSVAGGSGGCGPISASDGATAATWWSEGDPFDIRTQFWVMRRKPTLFKEHRK